MTLDEWIDQLAEHLAHSRGWTEAEARRWVEVRLIESREEYRQAGAPLGDTDEGLIAWLAPRYQPPSA